MIYSIDKSFERDAKKVPVQILRALTDVIRSINMANNLREISNIKKLQGYKNCYRIRIDDYRLGLYVEDGKIVLSRLLPRKDIYKRFP